MAADKALIKRSLSAIKHLQEALADARRGKEAIAIVGAACRFPGDADSPAAFWNLLNRAEEAIGPIPASRWEAADFYHPDPQAKGYTYMRKGGFIKDVDRFDAGFFKISPREAHSMDPQQRLLLQLSWQALEDAGIRPSTLQEKKAGVYMGIGQNDYAQLCAEYFRDMQVDAYYGSGNGHCFTPGRIAHLLDLRGPNLAVDTACSSSLVACSLAVEQLQSGQCHVALAGGVQLILSPLVTTYLSRAGALSPSDRCSAFGADANGFVRGEGAGLFVLKRLSDALRDGDHIYSLIRAVQVNHDGRSQGLTIPNARAQAGLLRDSILQAGIKKEEVAYIEAHGTGTELGDPIELQAIQEAYAGTARTSPLWVGSAKSSIGHLEAAAGAVGLLKASLVLQKQQIPASLHASTRNPHFDWEQSQIDIPQAAISLPTGAMAATSSFGLSGTNAHAILEAAPAPLAPMAEQAQYLLCLSSHEASLLDEHRKTVAAWLRETEDHSLAAVCYTANACREHFGHRLAVTGSSREALADALLQAALHQSKTEEAFTPAPLTAQEAEPLLTALQATAAAFCAGNSIDWAAHYAGNHTQKCSIPVRPFRKDRYWFTELPRPAALLRSTDPAAEAQTTELQQTVPAERTAPTGLSQLGKELSSLPAKAARSRMEAHLQEATARLLAWPAGQTPGQEQGFFDLGMDSMSGMQLKNQLESDLGIALDATLIFEYSNIRELGAYLLQALQNGAQPATTSTAGQRPKAGTATRLSRRSNDTDELIAALEAALQDLNHQEHG